MTQNEAPVGTIATIGHPSNGRVIEKTAPGVWHTLNGMPIDPEEFRAGWQWVGTRS